MSALAVLAVALGVLAAGEGVVLAIQARRADRAATAAEQVCADRVAEVQTQVTTCAGDLGECRARVTAESLTAAATGTTDALGAALAPELAEVQARAGLVLAIPRIEVTHALLGVASPQMVASLERLLSCDAADAAGVKKPLGCDPTGPYVDAWTRAVEALPACPAPSEGQAPE